MGCACNGARSNQASGGWWVTTVTGEKVGPYLTATEARIAAQAAGGGVVKQAQE
ncbi:DUF7196 family protein [Nocardia panacis]|uniref:DUF7196 family protein n=1 Tax=Nocardia panacis TaxID=2340916 RepID=UPI0026978C67